MKIRLRLLLFAGSLAGLLAAPAAGRAATPDTERIAAAILKFYTEYGTLFAGSGTARAEAELCREFLLPDLLEKVRQVREEQFYDPIVRAQDFDPASIATLTVVHAEGDRYIVGYTDPYHGSRISIPVEAREIEGRIRLTDIVLE